MKFHASTASVRRILLLGLPSAFSTVVFAFLHQRGLTNLLVDAHSHWIHVFLMVDSVTPGITQLGFWPPLLHLALWPVAFVLPTAILKDVGAFVLLLPVLLCSAFFLRGLLRYCGVSQALALVGAALVIVHPFVQYFSSSAMSEIPLVFAVLGSAYFAAKWRARSKMKDLSLFGVFVSLTVLARYEGALIAPLAASFVLFDRLEKRVSFSQMKAEMIIFIFMASLGPLFVMGYSYIYSGSVFGFLDLGSDRIFQTTSFARTAVSLEGAYAQLRHFYYASVHMHGRIVVAMFPFAVLLMLLRRKWDEILLLLMLMAPAMFIVFMMVIGRNSIAVPDLQTGPVQERFFANTRYALTWVGALHFAFILAIDQFSSVGIIGRAIRFLGAALVLSSSIVWFVYVAGVTDFSTIRRDQTASYPLSVAFFQQYDGGRVLMTRDHNVREIYFSIIPIDKLVLETNYRYFAQAMREPWLFVRWVVIRSQATQRGNFKNLNDLLALEANPAFQAYYELADTMGPIRVYRLRSYAVRSASVMLGYDPAKIPSLNDEAAWIPQRIYEEMVKR